MVNVKKGDKGKLLVQFLPFVRGDYRCLFVFSDEKVGEFAVQFQGKALATAPFEKAFVQTESNTPMLKEVVFPLKNAALERGLSFFAERFKQVPCALACAFVWAYVLPLPLTRPCP